MSARRLSRGRGAFDRPACAHARILALAAGSCQLFCCGEGCLPIWPFSLLVWGRGCPKFYRAGRPLPPYQSARKSSGKLPKSKDYQLKAVLHNVRYGAFVFQADCQEVRGLFAGRREGILNSECARGGGRFIPLLFRFYFIARSFVCFCIIDTLPIPINQVSEPGGYVAVARMSKNRGVRIR